MIGIDTNILVRLFAKDDLVQYEAAVAFIDGVGKGEKIVVNIVVIVELMWTLRRIYKFEREQISAVLRKLTEHPNLLILDLEVVRNAAHRALDQGGDIADHIIALLNREAGSEATYTFDEEAANCSDFVLLPS